MVIDILVKAVDTSQANLDDQVRDGEWSSQQGVEEDHVVVNSGQVEIGSEEDAYLLNLNSNLDGSWVVAEAGAVTGEVAVPVCGLGESGTGCTPLEVGGHPTSIWGEWRSRNLVRRCDQHDFTEMHRSVVSDEVLDRKSVSEPFSTRDPNVGPMKRPVMKLGKIAILLSIN